MLFSAADVESIKEKLLVLKTMLPQCELVINSKPYYTKATAIFICALQQLPFTYRLKIKKESLIAAWSSWLSQAGEDYIVAEVQGSFPFDAIEWVEIKPIEKTDNEKFSSAKTFDSSETIIKLLEVLDFPYMIYEGIFSVYILNKEI